VEQQLFAGAVEFFLIIWGKLSELELEPEPEFLTSWSRSRTKMDRLRNTGAGCTRRRRIAEKNDQNY
jgi:hypothetical protein